MIDNTIKIKATVEWMKEHYDKANAELFNGQLKECEFEIKPIGSRFLGQFHISGRYNKLYADRYSRRMFIEQMFSGNREYINYDNFTQLCHPAIYLNSNYSGTELSLYTTLVHEMCHYYTYIYGYSPKQAHGPEFKQIGFTVSERSNGLFTIQRIASAEEMSGYELDDNIQQQVDKRKENKMNRLSYLIIVTKNGDIRMVNTINMGLIDEIVNIHDKSGGKVYKLLNHDIALELYKLGYRQEMRTYKYWTLNPDSIVVKEIFANQNNYKSLTDDYLMEQHIMKRNDAIEITPNMNLGLESPLEHVDTLSENKGRKIRLTEEQFKEYIKQTIKENGRR